MRRIMGITILLMRCALFLGAVPASAGEERAWARQELIYKLSQSLPLNELARVVNDPRFQINAAKIASPRWFFDPSLNMRDPVERGKRFWRMHESTLERAESRFGVPQEIVISVLRRENNFGIYFGGPEVINTLARFSLKAGKKKRARSLRELECFIRLSIQERWDPFFITGSSEGAFALPQFMPCSYLAFAVDGNGDGIVDPFANWDDAIMSVANHLRSVGWRKLGPQRALFRYNQDDEYGERVLAFAREVRVATRRD